MFSRLRTARPTNDLAPLKRFYVEGLGCRVEGEWVDHDGFDGLVVGDGNGSWEVEFIVERGHRAPVAPGPEHLLVFYVADPDERDRCAASLDAVGGCRVPSNNPYWDAHGVTFADPDGYRVVLAAPTSG